MTTHRRYLLVLFCLFSFGKWLPAQAEFHLRLQSDGITYTVYMQSQSDWLAPVNNLLHYAAVSVVVPADGLVLDQLESHLGQWQMTHLIEQPIEHAGADYLLFELVGTVTDMPFPAGVEIPMFSFKNGRSCSGAFELMDIDSDPFAVPNSLNIPMGQHFVIEGAGGEAYTGNYNIGSADCMGFLDCNFQYEMNEMSTGYYEVLLHTSNSLPDTTSLQSLKVAIKVPTNYFQLYDLTNLQAGKLGFAGVMRFDAPVEEPGFDYFVINMAGIGNLPMPVDPNTAIPLLRFGNGGSCQGDSIFLVQNTDDPFFPPNFQHAQVRQQVTIANAAYPEAVCLANAAVACTGCLFNNNAISITDVVMAGPVLCLGQTEGSIQIVAEGADSLEYSLDGGLNWQTDPLFNHLPIGSYQPLVRGWEMGCMVATAVPPVMLMEETQIDLQIGFSPKVCEGEDLAFEIVSPVNLPLTATYEWSGPLGFSESISDPVLFDVNTYQSGIYSLTLDVPGCDMATVSSMLEVVTPQDVPTLISNAPICDGEPLELRTDVSGVTYEWLGPAGQSAATLALPGLTTASDTTVIPADHPAYLSGEWRVRLVDSNGCKTTSLLKELTIKERPQAFAANDGPVCLGANAELSARPLPGATYFWRVVGDTTIYSFEEQPVLTNVNSQQAFELEVEVEGCLSDNIATTTVALYPKPSAFPVFDYQLAADCAPEDIQLTANAGGIGLTYQWEGNNGFYSQVENPLIVNADAQSNGAYQLKVTNIHGCTAVSPFDITGVVDAVESPDVISSGSACPGEDISLTVQSYNGPQVGYQWFKNNTAIPGAVSSHLQLNAVESSDVGMYRVEVEVDACKVISDDLQVEILPLPEPEPDFVLTFPCEGATLQFLSNADDISTWQWTGPNGFTSAAQNPVIYNTEFNDVGTYSLLVTGQNGCTAASSTLVDGILPVPEVPQVASNSPVCPEDAILLVVQNPTLLGTVYYEWINGIGEYVGNGTETLELSTIDPKAIPPFLVRKNVNGCASELSDPVIVEVKPTPVANAENSGAVCPGSVIDLFAASVDDANYTWRMAGDPQIISFEQNTQVILQDTTIFELTVTTNGCDAVSVDSTVAIPALEPGIATIVGGGTYCEGSSLQLTGLSSMGMGLPIQYSWTGPNGFQYTNMASNDSFTVAIDILQTATAGAYTLELLSAEGCYSTPLSVVVNMVDMPVPPALEVSSNLHCEGEQLQLDATGYSGNTVNYYWYFDDGANTDLLDVTTVPTYFIEDLIASQSGIYYVEAEVDGCRPPASNSQQVDVLGIGSAILASNPTTSLDPVCAGTAVQLEATLVPGATYSWVGPGGFQSNGYAPVVPFLDMSTAGIYTVEIQVPGCLNLLSTSTEVFVTPLPDVPHLSGPTEVCAGDEVILTIDNAAPNTAFHFYFNQNNTLIESGVNPALVLSQILEGQSGEYYALAEKDGCLSVPSLMHVLSVVERENVAPVAGMDQVACEAGELITLHANTPTVGVGKWTSLGDALIVQPDQEATAIQSLQAGENSFVWTISQPVCSYERSDTMLVYLEHIIAHPDDVMLELSDTLSVLDVQANDVHNSIGWDIQVVDWPGKGLVDVDQDGIASYRPYPNVFGSDEMIYETCSMNCPSVCDTAIVRYFIDHSLTNNSDCFVPNLVTPNGDQENDVFVIPCAAIFEGSELVVYNRYGTPVYQNANYQNDWGGTYDGAPLPAGTYFYQLSLNDEKRTRLQGYVAVLR